MQHYQRCAQSARNREKELELPRMLLYLNELSVGPSEACRQISQ